MILTPKYLVCIVASTSLFKPPLHIYIYRPTYIPVTVITEPQQTEGVYINILHTRLPSPSGCP